jgi:hypothetical protein
MTLNELNTLFDAACNAQQRANSEDVSLWSCRGAGLKAVVAALRDELRTPLYHCSWEDIDDFLTEILAIAGEDEKAAGGSTREDGQGALSSPVAKPAAAPVCEWTKGQKGGVRPSCSDLYEYAPYVTREGKCPECGLPIKFKEAANEQ